MGINNKIEAMQNTLMKLTNRLKRNKYINAVSDGLIAIFPILMVGALFAIVNNLQYEPFVNFLIDT